MKYFPRIALVVSIAATISACGSSAGPVPDNASNVLENAQQAQSESTMVKTNIGPVVTTDAIASAIDMINAGEDSDQWRDDYLRETEQALRDQMGDEFPESTYQWVIEKELQTSLVQAVGPDPRILKNLENVLNNLHPETSDKYANMIFAIVVARRVDGVGAVEYNSDRFAKIAQIEEASLSANDLRKQSERLQVVNILSHYLDENGWDTAMAFDNADTVIAYLNERPEMADFSSVKYSTPLKFATLLNQVNLTNGLIKKRDPNATVVEYINHIARIQSQHVEPFVGKKREHIPGTEIFPHNAPWPLLMPLAEGRPVSEMEWIFERFADVNEDPNHRLRKYGNYNRADARAPLVASTLYPQDSLQEINQVGGLCGTMSQVGRGTYISMGIPSFGSGQPGHANLMRYNFNKGSETYIASTEQSVASLYNTTPDWHFFEDNSQRIGRGGREAHGEYVLGLALAMNYDMQRYLDNRTLVRMAASLDESRNDDKRALLTLAIEKSPFNSEAWYDLYELTGKNMNDAISMTQFIRSILLNNKPEPSNGIVDPIGNPDEDLSAQLEIVPGLEKGTIMYRDTLIAEFLEQAWLKGEKLPASYRTFIENENRKNTYTLDRYYSNENYEAAQSFKKGKLLEDKSR